MVGVVAATVFVMAAAPQTKGTKVRIGGYDSRVIAVVGAQSAGWGAEMRKKMQEKHDAEKAGDLVKVKELEAWGERMQQNAHLKAFGTAPVTEIMEKIKDKLPKIAAEANVCVIVSKWQIDFKADNAETVDLTEKIAGLVDPNQKNLKNIVEEMGKHKPASEEEILSHKD
ncbi:MAG: hypothetical protein A2178_03735 [Planctomycetes bacterium GWC2_49_10]|nr:MAG: hypothetical protein A2178_03735 [Planctomycetes bacterium GWC2_49_10]